MEEVEKVQYQAGLAITGAWQGSSRSKLYEELGWESLSDRRWCRRILQIHKIVKIKPLSISKTNFLVIIDPYTGIMILLLFMKYDVNPADT